MVYGMSLAKFVEIIVVVHLASFSLINNKIGSVLVTQHCSVCAQPLVPWKCNNAFCVYYWDTYHCLQYNNIECCIKIAFVTNLWRGQQCNIRRSSHKVSAIFVQFLLNWRRLNRFSLKFPVPNFVQISQLGAILMQVDGQTGGCDEADRCFLRSYKCA
jgi:hypothetical protein